MVEIKLQRGIENLKKLKPLTVLEVVKNRGNNSEELKFVPERTRYNLWNEAVWNGNEGFSGILTTKTKPLSEGRQSLIVQIEPYTETDETAIKNFKRRIEDAMGRYEKYKHPGTGVPDNTDYSNQIIRFKHFYLEGLDGTLPERK